MRSLASVYGNEAALGLLYQLLLERDPLVNISHKQMPTFKEHADFVALRPYPSWYVVRNEQDVDVGSVYLTDAREIGVFILRWAQRQGHGEWAVHEIMRRHSGRFFANIAPGNLHSLVFFERLGFKTLQITCVKEPCEKTE